MSALGPGRNCTKLDDTRRQLIALLPELRGYARFLARGTAEADDLVQDALLRALGALPGLQDTTSLRAWLFAILRNTFFEQARRRRTERTALLYSAGMHGAGQPTSSAPAQPGHLDVDDLQRQLFALPPLLREALVLVGAHGLSYEEAAVICGVPAGTVKARVSRARSRLALAMSTAPVAGS